MRPNGRCPMPEAIALDHGIGDECFSCGEGDPVNECPSAQRACGHHCNCIWTQDNCHWCGLEATEHG